MSDRNKTCVCTAYAVLEQQETATIGLDQALCVTYMNPAAEVLLTVSAKHSIGVPIKRIVSFPAEVLVRMNDALAHERRTTEREVPIYCPAQDARSIIDCTISPFIRDHSSIGLLLEIHNVDQQLRIARENNMLSQQEFSRNLLRGLAHEIKNPLGGIRGAAQLLARELEDESQTEYTDIIIREADRLHGLIDRMLGPHNRPNPAEVNIHEVLEYVHKLIQAEAPESVEILTDYDPSIPTFFTDRDHLVQVFLNVAGNALQALNGKGTIKFMTRVGRYVTIGSKLHRLVGLIDIEDNGPGIPDDLSDSLFYPMTTGRADGTGLGLSIAQSLVNQQGGIIECRSKPGKTVFTILIPLEVKDVS